jgi:hypothetical protein
MLQHKETWTRDQLVACFWLLKFTHNTTKTHSVHTKLNCTQCAHTKKHWLLCLLMPCDMCCFCSSFLHLQDHTLQGSSRKFISCKGFHIPIVLNEKHLYSNQENFGAKRKSAACLTTVWAATFLHCSKICLVAISNVSQSIKSVVENPHLCVNILVNHPVD